VDLAHMDLAHKGYDKTSSLVFKASQAGEARLTL